MEIGKYTLEVKDGIIKITPSAREYYTVAESVANSLAGGVGATEEWCKICLEVINALDYHSKSIKATIVSKISCETGFYPVGMEVVKGRTFEETIVYVEGYADAVKNFKPILGSIENSLIQILDEVLPCHTK